MSCLGWGGGGGGKGESREKSEAKGSRDNRISFPPFQITHVHAHCRSLARKQEHDSAHRSEDHKHTQQQQQQQHQPVIVNAESTKTLQLRPADARTLKGSKALFCQSDLPLARAVAIDDRRGAIMAAIWNPSGLQSPTEDKGAWGGVGRVTSF